ncbi:G5 domain-containing protein [Candidatus Saccharibacteria bacterium]|nr:G5 domain-containing protein [Candidatus Saccharibacteria bacterium]
MKKPIILISLIALVAYGAYGVITGNFTVQAADTRIVKVFIDGDERTIATNAKTVAEVMKTLESPLGEFDKTEPSLDAEVHGGDFTINVYRARPIAVVDGANSYTVMTAERSPKLIATEAGFATSQEDQFAFERSDDPFEGTPGTELTIKRAKTFNLDLYGTTTAVRTNEDTVADFLKSKDITLEDGDELNVPKQQRITEGMLLSVAQINRNIETVEEVAPFPEQQIQDAQQPLSYKKIQSPGKNGKKIVTYELVSRNGGQVERKVIKEVITEQPVQQVVVVGARATVPYTGGGNKTEWMTAAGISQSDWGYAEKLIAKESGWNPNALNKNSGACGLVQALPCSKLGPNWNDPVVALRWGNSYVGRYGGWAGAWAHSQQKGWY